MPYFNLTTIERWEHKVRYCDIDAESLEQALDSIRQGNEAYHEQTVMEGGDEVLFLHAADDEESRTIEIPEALATEPPNYDTVAELLSNVTASLDSVLAHYTRWVAPGVYETAAPMPAADRLHRTALVKQAQALLRKIYPDHVTA